MSLDWTTVTTDKLAGETRNPHAIASVKPRDAAQPQSVRRS